MIINATKQEGYIFIIPRLMKGFEIRDKRI